VTDANEFARRRTEFTRQHPGDLAELADSLLSPGWYANWNSDTEATVVFHGRPFPAWPGIAFAAGRSRQTGMTAMPRETYP